MRSLDSLSIGTVPPHIVRIALQKELVVIPNSPLNLSEFEITFHPTSDLAN